MKRRLDVALVERGLAGSRAKAQALILAGVVFSGDRRLDKAGRLVDCDTALEIRGRPHPWVSRGGLKLEKGLDAFAIPADGRIAVDIGASTGGFTDVLLARGARLVHAVDVGRGQLAWRLRRDPRVVVMEGVNARHLTDAQLGGAAPDLIVCDASFIGLATVLPASLSLAAPGAHLVALIKPQFEAGRDSVGKGGVVRDPEVHRQVCRSVRTWLERLGGWRVLGLTGSPVRGADGNAEFLIGAEREGRGGQG